MSAGALVKGVLPQPVHHLHHTLVVGVQRLVGLAQFHQLFEAGGGGHLAALLRRAHIARQGVELGGVAAQVIGVGHHQPDAAARVGLDLGHPGNVIGLGGGHHHLGQRSWTPAARGGFGVLHAHHVGDAAHVHRSGSMRR
jgi:hypothetical protein